jgi:hypothetical protein
MKRPGVEVVKLGIVACYMLRVGGVVVHRWTIDVVLCRAVHVWRNERGEDGRRSQYLRSREHQLVIPVRRTLIQIRSFV